MALRAKAPEAVTKRLKLFMFGPAGVGKTTAALSFPKPYIIDTERGSENYDKLIKSVGGAVFQTLDIQEVTAEVKSLLTEKHDYRTLVIDPITAIYQNLLDQCEQKVGSDFGRHYGAANKQMKRLINLIMQLDMNCVMTAHAKKEYGPKLEVLGQTFDAMKSLDYVFDLVIELVKTGRGKQAKRIGRVAKTRIETFPDGEEFDWGYDAIKERYDAATMEREAQAVALADDDQLATLRDLLETVKVPDDWAEKALNKAGVEDWADMPTDKMQKCIEYLTGKLGRNRNTKTAEKNGAGKELVNA